MTKIRATLSLLFASIACSTTPPARVLNVEVSWVKPSSQKQNWEFQHAERSAPLVDGNTVYQGNGVDGLSAFQISNGKLLWHIDVEHGVESSPVVVGDLLYFGGSDGQFYAVNKASGKIAWIFPTRVENLSEPLVKDGVVYFLAGNNVFYALDGQTGKQLWFYNRGDISSLSVRGGTTPAIFNGTLYVGFSDGYIVALNSKDGSMVWERKINSNPKFVDVDGSPVVDKDFIWVSSFDGALLCLSRNDGQVLWRVDDGGAVPVTIEGDVLYYASLNQKIYALNKKTGQKKWTYSYAEDLGVPTQPSLFKGLLIFGTSEGDLLAISEQSGQYVGRYRPGAGVFARVGVDKKRGLLFVYSNATNLHVLKINWASARDMVGMN